MFPLTPPQSWAFLILLVYGLWTVARATHGLCELIAQLIARHRTAAAPVRHAAFTVPLAGDEPYDHEKHGL